jgi:probable HAF family extracellular repeat protein
MKIFKTARLCLAFVWVLPAFALAQTYSVISLSALKGDNESAGFWINNLGEVVGCSDTATSEGYPCTGQVSGQHAFLWTPSGGLKDLSTLPGGNVSAALGINDSGIVVGYSNVGGQPATDFYAFQWTKSGGMVNLGALPGGPSSAAFAISALGKITGDSFVSNGNVNATAWYNGKIRNLGSLPNAIFTAGLGVNKSGYVVGESVFSYGPPFQSHGFFWNGSSMADLGTLSGGVSSMANAINTGGVIVGQSDGTNTGGNWHAVMWDTNHKIHDLGVLFGGTYSVAFAVNDSNVVVGYGNLSNNAAHAMIWTSSSGMQDLNDLIPTNSGWVLINAYSINNVGQITGYGLVNGHNHAFLLTPQ